MKSMRKRKSLVKRKRKSHIIREKTRKKICNILCFIIIFFLGYICSALFVDAIEEDMQIVLNILLGLAFAGIYVYIKNSIRDFLKEDNEKGK